MNQHKSSTNPHSDVLSRIQRGLSGYVSYLAACEMNSSFSEYVLYEPILRILNARGYEAICEKECPGFDNNTLGDKKRIDFEAAHPNHGTFVMEVKWAKPGKLDVIKDYDKLIKYRSINDSVSCYLCVFGRKSVIENLALNVGDFRKCGNTVIAEFGKTKFGCRIYQI